MDARCTILTSRNIAGRAGEVASVNLETMVWDSFQNAVYAEVMQVKTSKTKTVSMVCGANRHLCEFLVLFDYLVSGTRLIGEDIFTRPP